MYVEERINALRQPGQQTPFGWLICFDGRPLQGIPPQGSGPHIMFFSAENKAQAFIIDRKKYFGAEPLSVVAIDSPDSLKMVALGSSADTRYVAPPCGIVLDFDYSTKKARKLLKPADVNSMLPVEIDGALGLIPSQASTMIAKPVKQAPVIVEPKSQPGSKRPQKTVLIVFGSLLAVGLLLLCIGAVWFGFKRGMIPSLPSLQKPANTAQPTRAVAPAALPTVAASPTPMQAAWNVNIKDDFSANDHGWPLGSNKQQYGSTNIAITGGKLVYELTSVENCWFWYYPDLPSVSDFDTSVDVQRVEGSVTGDYGMVLRANGDDNSFYYFGINDNNQQFAFFLIQNGNWTRLNDWTFNTNIRVGDINHLRVVSKGSLFVLYINGNNVGQADDTSLSSGKVGIFAELYDSGDRINIDYDNLVLHGNP